jgi:hypothetical protein
MFYPFNNAAFSVELSGRPDPLVGTLFSFYDENFIWTDEHIPPSQLNKWRQIGDKAMDEFYNEWSEELESGMDMYEYIQQRVLDFVGSIRQ